jgi:hypothetical protein
MDPLVGDYFFLCFVFLNFADSIIYSSASVTAVMAEQLAAQRESLAATARATHTSLLSTPAAPPPKASVSTLPSIPSRPPPAPPLQMPVVPMLAASNNLHPVPQIPHGQPAARNFLQNTFAAPPPPPPSHVSVAPVAPGPPPSRPPPPTTSAPAPTTSVQTSNDANEEEESSGITAAGLMEESLWKSTHPEDVHVIVLLPNDDR